MALNVLEDYALYLRVFVNVSKFLKRLLVSFLGRGDSNFLGKMEIGSNNREVELKL